MDSNDLEKERGITILAKCTSIEWTGASGTTRINIIDTPATAISAAEAKRTLPLFDAVILLFAPAGGPWRRTKLFTARPLALGPRRMAVVTRTRSEENTLDLRHLLTTSTPLFWW